MAWNILELMNWLVNVGELVGELVGDGMLVMACW